jgi:hypothetical protein
MAVEAFVRTGIGIAVVIMSGHTPLLKSVTTNLPGWYRELNGALRGSE